MSRSPSFQSNEATNTTNDTYPLGDKKIVSPPRSGPQGGRINTEHSSQNAQMTASDDRPPSLNQASPRFVSFQEQEGDTPTNAVGGDGGSPRNYLTTSDRPRTMVNHVSPLTQAPNFFVEGTSIPKDSSGVLSAKFKLDLSSMRVPESPYPRTMGGSYDSGGGGGATRLRSNRGGSRAVGRTIRSRDSIPSPPQRSAFPVSTRGRGLCTSSRGRGRIYQPPRRPTNDAEQQKQISQNTIDILRLYRNEHPQGNAKRQRVGNAPHDDAIVSR